MGDFSFAGEHSTLYHVRLLKSPISVLPGTRDKIITLPGRHGSLRMLPDLGERSLQLECWLAASTIAELHRRLENVRAWLNPLRGVQRLIFDSTPDRFYNATYAGGNLDAETTAMQGLFSIDFVCPDPFAYSDDREVHQNIISLPGRIKITSFGSLATYPTITVTNQATQIMTGFNISYFKEV